MRKMRLFVMTALAVVTGAAGFSQADYTDCGCPPIGSRTPVDLATLADADGN
jgi:hypothetical protein